MSMAVEVTVTVVVVVVAVVVALVVVVCEQEVGFGGIIDATNEARSVVSLGPECGALATLSIPTTPLSGIRYGPTIISPTNP